MNDERKGTDTCEQARSVLPFLYQCLNAFSYAFIVAIFLRAAVRHNLFNNTEAAAIGVAVLTFGFGYVQDRRASEEADE